MTKLERNTRAVELWLESNSWRGIALKLTSEGFGAVSHQYVARVVKRELTRAWEGASRTPRYYSSEPVFQRVATSQWHEPFAELDDTDEDETVSEVSEQPGISDAPATTTEIIVESFFNARHFVILEDEPGAPHSHSYRARLMATGTVDPKSGIVIGFAEAQAILDNAVMHFAEELLNRLEVFSDTQPTTENVALTISNSVGEQLQQHGLRVTSVTLWESPTKGVTVTINPNRNDLPGRPPEITEAGDQPFASS